MYGLRSIPYSSIAQLVKNLSITMTTASTIPNMENAFVDLSGVSATTDNPYDALIAASHDNPVSLFVENCYQHCK